MSPDEILARVLYKDQDVIILNKPSGLAVHAGPNSSDHLELYLGPLAFGWANPPRLAHRLDRDTSGCLVLGRHDKAISRLGKAFMAGRVDKTYWAVVWGCPSDDRGRIDQPLYKITGKGGWRMVIDPRGQKAVTDWRVLARHEGFSLIECHPRTGRTHQIRLHLKHLGCPIRGDAYYGPDAQPAFPLHLHSRAIAVPALSSGKQPVSAVAPVPPHMAFIQDWLA